MTLGKCAHAVAACWSSDGTWLLLDLGNVEFFENRQSNQ